jgi:hypothetical protein
MLAGAAACFIIDRLLGGAGAFPAVRVALQRAVRRATR